MRESHDLVRHREIDQVTQRNAALVEQSVAAASRSREQAARLTDAVAVFTLKR